MVAALGGGRADERRLRLHRRRYAAAAAGRRQRRAGSAAGSHPGNVGLGSVGSLESLDVSCDTCFAGDAG